MSVRLGNEAAFAQFVKDTFSNLIFIHDVEIGVILVEATYLINMKDNNRSFKDIKVRVVPSDNQVKLLGSLDNVLKLHKDNIDFAVQAFINYLTLKQVLPAIPPPEQFRNLVNPTIVPETIVIKDALNGTVLDFVNPTSVN